MYDRCILGTGSDPADRARGSSQLQIGRKPPRVRRHIKINSAWARNITASLVPQFLDNSYGHVDWVSLTWFPSATNWPAQASATLLTFALSAIAPLPQAEIARSQILYQYVNHGDGDKVKIGSSPYAFDGNPLGDDYITNTRSVNEYDTIIIFNTTQWTDGNTLTRFSLQSYHTGYGYNKQGVPVCLALAALALYCLVISSYIIYSVYSRHVASSWDSIGELLLLALNSHRPESLRATSVDASTLAVSKEPVSVKVNEHNITKLVFNTNQDIDNRQYRHVEANVKYWYLNTTVSNMFSRNSSLCAIPMSK